LLKAASDNGISIISLDECYELSGQIFLSLEYHRLIDPTKFLDAELFNVHFSKLPAYRGMFTSAIPIINAELESGVTLHKIDSGIDTGDIIDQLSFPIDSEDTAKTLYFKYLRYSKKLLDRNIFAIVNGLTTASPQPSTNASYYSVKSIDYKNLKVNLRATAEQIRNQIRAFNFPEYQVPKVHGFWVNGATKSPDKSLEEPGTLLSLSAVELAISTLDYNLILCRDQNSELFESVKAKNLQLVASSISLGANVNMRNSNGWTPLMVASFNGSEGISKILVDRGADVNLPNYEGTTPLMHAMSFYERSGNRKIFDFLLSKGADLDLFNRNSKTVRDYAKERGLFELL
jgi:methionyl-tRNA formyltransferase